MSDIPIDLGLESEPQRQRFRRRRLGVAVVGLGYWGPNLVRALWELPNVDVLWLCDLDEDRLAGFTRRYPATRCTTDFDDVLRDPAIDAVLIATPVFTHAGLVERSLAAGKHTFVEKPLASSTGDAERLLAQAADAKLVLMCGHTFIYSPPVRAIKRLLDADQLGELFFISSSRVNLGLHQRDVSVLWDLGPHDFSILLYWLGCVPETIRATGRDSIVRGITDVAFIQLGFPGGLLANVELSWLAPSKLRRTVLVGADKMVVYEDGAPEPVRIYDHGVVYEDPETFGEYHLSYRTGDILSPKVDAIEPIALELEDFLTAARAGAAPARYGWFAQHVVSMVEAAEQSLTEGGEMVRLSSREPVGQPAYAVE